MEKKWKWIERAVWALTLIIGVLLYFRDEAKDDAMIETQLNILIENDKQRTEYWNKQNEINGRIMLYMQLDSPELAGSGSP